VARKGEIVGAVDFGSREVRVVIALEGNDGTVQILGHGAAQGNGCVSQGLIQDLSAAQRALKQALHAAEKEAGFKVSSLFCGLSGTNVESFIREGVVKLDRDVVELGHLEEALDLASRDILAAGRHVISSITSQEWYVDDLRVSDPVGIRGGVLKTRVHFAQIPSVIEDNIVSCIESQGRELEDMVFLPLAAGLGCLTPEDTELGVAILDMGHSTTSLAVYRGRRIVTTHCFDWGGFHFTRDVAAGLHVSFEEADELVLEYGLSEALIEQEHGEAPEDAGKEQEPSGRSAHIKLKSAVHGAPAIVDREKLEMIIFERSRELLHKVHQHMNSRGLSKHLVRGMILTGGAAAIRNQVRLAEAVFQVPSRQGLPVGIDVMPQPVQSSAYTPVVGVARHGFEYRAAARNGRIEVRRGLIGTVVHAIVSFFGRYFF
jgi:cell division protein FtsA